MLTFNNGDQFACFKLYIYESTQFPCVDSAPALDTNYTILLFKCKWTTKNRPTYEKESTVQKRKKKDVEGKKDNSGGNQLRKALFINYFQLTYVWEYVKINYN